MKPKYFFKQGPTTSRVSVANRLKISPSIHCFSGEKDLAQAVPHGICIHFVAHLMLFKQFSKLFRFTFLGFFWSRRIHDRYHSHHSIFMFPVVTKALYKCLNSMNKLPLTNSVKENIQRSLFW